MSGKIFGCNFDDTIRNDDVIVTSLKKMPSLQLLCIIASSSLSVHQGQRRSFRALFFEFDIVFAAITVTFLAVVVQSNSYTLIRFGLIAVVSYHCALQYYRLGLHRYCVICKVK